MRILVTGGTGFIGSHVLTQFVTDGHTVACFDLDEPSPIAATVADDVEFIRGDMTDTVQVYNTVAAFEPDRIVHLAAMLGRGSQRNPRAAFAVNVDGTLDLFEAAVHLGVERVVTAASVSSYGNVPPEVERLDETVVQRPSNVYGLTKYAVEHLGRLYRDRYGLEFAAMEPVHGLGPDRLRGNVEDSFIVKAAVAGEPLTVPRIEEAFEIIYVTDTARAFVAATLSEELPHTRYLVGSEETASLADIVEMVREYVPDAEFAFSERRGGDEFASHPMTDTSCIRTDLGWEPEHTIAEGVEAYVEWLRANPEKWTFDPAAVPWA
jgi:UDP-glucose 4-epimerase